MCIINDEGKACTYVSVTHLHILVGVDMNLTYILDIPFFQTQALLNVLQISTNWYKSPFLQTQAVGTIDFLQRTTNWYEMPDPVF